MKEGEFDDRAGALGVPPVDLREFLKRNPDASAAAILGFCRAPPELLGVATELSNTRVQAPDRGTPPWEAQNQATVEGSSQASQAPGLSERGSTPPLASRARRAEARVGVYLKNGEGCE